MLYFCEVFISVNFYYNFAGFRRDYRYRIVWCGWGWGIFFFFRIMKISSIRVRYSNIVIFTSIGMSEDFFFFLFLEISDIFVVVFFFWCFFVRIIFIMFVFFLVIFNVCMIFGDFFCFFCYGKDVFFLGKEWYGIILSFMEFGESKL